MNKYFVILIIWGISNIFGQSNQAKIDSLLALDRDSPAEQVRIFSELSVLYTSIDFNKAFKYAKSAHEIAVYSEDFHSATKQYITISKLYYNRQMYDSAIVYLKATFDYFKWFNDKKLIAVVYTQLGLNHERFYDYSKANEFHFSALKFSRDVRDSIGIASSLNNLGLNNWRTGNYQEAERYYLQALGIRKRLNQYKALSITYNNLGVLHWNWGNYFKALKFYLDALDLKEKSKDSTGLILTNNNIGMLYQKFGDLDKTKYYYFKSLELSEKINYRFGLAYSNENIGTYCMEQKIYNEADNYFQKALEIYKEIGHKNGQSNVYNSLGKLYFILAKYNEALNFHLSAYKLAAEASDKKAIVLSLNNLGKTYNFLGQTDKAQQYLYIALDLLKATPLADQIKYTYAELSLSYEKRNDVNKAFYYMKLYKNITDSLYDAENLRMINDLKEKYETDRREKENEVLRSKTIKQNYELKKQSYVQNLSIIALVFFALLTSFLFYSNRQKKLNNRIILKSKEEVETLNTELNLINKQLSTSENNLKELNATKDKFFSIIAHDLRNPFMSILGFLDLLTNSFDEYDDTDKKLMLSNTAALALNTYKLLENLLQWARLQTEGIHFYPRNLDFNRLVESCIESLKPSSSLKKIQLIFYAAQKVFYIGDEEMLNTIIRNIISNSIKFTPEGGNITVDLAKDESHVQLTITDTGIGMDEKTVENLFKVGVNASRKGTKGEKGTGIGLLLAQEFTAKHHGTINVTSEIGKGTSFVINLPILEETA